MDTRRAPLDAAPLAAPRWRPIAALADPGTSHTALPVSLLRDLGIEPTGRASVRLIDGATVVYPRSIARLRLEGRESYGRVVFVEDGLEPRLGFITLADMGLEIDPETQGLVE